MWHRYVSRQNKTIQLYFVLGRKARYDNIQDVLGFQSPLNSSNFNIIRINLYEDYWNLSLKTIAMMQWISRHCTAAKYIAKVDDDTFVNIGSLINFLERADEHNVTYTILGSIAVSHTIPRKGKARSIWGVNKASYPLNYWPHYANGFFYLFTNDITQRMLARTAMRTTPIVNIEDVFLTGIVRVLENITLGRINIKTQCSKKDYVKPHVIAVHHFNHARNRCAPSGRKQRKAGESLNVIKNETY